MFHAAANGISRTRTPVGLRLAVRDPTRWAALTFLHHGRDTSEMRGVQNFARIGVQDGVQGGPKVVPGGVRTGIRGPKVVSGGILDPPPLLI